MSPGTSMDSPSVLAVRAPEDNEHFAFPKPLPSQGYFEPKNPTMYVSALFHSIPCAAADDSKFRILADGLLINKVTQNDTGEYACRAYQVNSIASDMQERTVLMKIERECDL